MNGPGKMDGKPAVTVKTNCAVCTKAILASPLENDTRQSPSRNGKPSLMPDRIISPNSITAHAMLLSNPIRKILTGIGVCLVSSLLALFTYTAAGWSLLDASYMVVITLFGIGYGEVHPISDPALKLQTMALIIVGCLSGLYSVGGFLQLVTEGEIKRALGAQKMSRGIKKMKEHTIICGYGRVGKMLASDLKARKLPLVVIDNEPSRLEEAENHGFTVVSGDAACDEVLMNAGVMRAQSLACVLPNDAINVFITLTGRDLNPDLEIISRAEDPRTERKLRRSGANHVILPASIGALRMAEIISQGHHEMAQAQGKLHPVSTSLRAITISEDDELASATLQMARETLHEIGSIVGFQRGNSELLANCDDAMTLKPGDIILVSSDD